MSQAIDRLANALETAAKNHHGDMYVTNLLKLAADTLRKQETAIELHTAITDRLLNTVNLVIAETKGVQ